MKPAFTLLEVCLALTLATLIFGVAVLGISGVQAEAGLKRSASQIETTARESLLRAVTSQRTIVLGLPGGLGIEGQMLIKRHGEKEFRAPKRGEVWEFNPTGICEPLEVRLSSPAGIIELGFDPLTACAIKKNVIVNG
ncbi:MAG TPA: hypothetical protein DIT64_11080 [Verrucomicrobiales bacterium]|nr:hypothetical protein [Verrucomicrobiales bacterium]HCN78268.1 hypothetical protein [Verrucomicrobiales bacterium]HRJ08715.1 hypothetical protein [Prosthecobacter sp.]HRK15211.1 hypothetical protein [Prosthecobacter sp.]